MRSRDSSDHRETTSPQSHGKSSRGRVRRSDPPSFPSRDRIRESTYSGKSSRVLKNLNCGLRPKTRKIHATIDHEGYKAFVIQAYEKLLEARPRLQYLLSLAEWLHVHMLLVYARMFECELHFHKIVLPGEFRIAIPRDIVVMEPIAAVLTSIGILEDRDRGVTYVPVARSFSGSDGYRPHNKDDVTEFLEWTQYDWNASWEKVEEGRTERRKLAAEKHLAIPETEDKFDVTKLEEWQQLAVEKWLGWDDDLWFSYHQACFILGRIAKFEPIPRDKSKKGSYAWLLPKHTTDTGASFVRIPRPDLNPDSWMIALMMNMCALEPEAMATWYYETNTVDDLPGVIDRFIGAAIHP